MDFSPDTGKNRRNTGGILRISCEPKASLIQSVAEVRRKIGGSDGGHELSSVSQGIGKEQTEK
jgi:hypothetical protein